MGIAVIANRYAKAIFEQVRDQEEAMLLEGSFIRWSVLFQIADAKKILSSDIAHASLKKDLLLAVLSPDAQKNELMQGLVAVLVRAGRSSLLIEISNEFQRLTDQKYRRARGQIISAKALEADDLESIRDVIKKRFNAESIDLENLVDSEIVGGICVRVGNSVLDVSLRSKIDALTASVSS